MTSPKHSCRRCLLSFALLVSSAVTLAQENVHPLMYDQFVVQAGAFLPRLSFKLSVDGSLTGEHPPLDFEQQFGAKDDDEVFAADLVWRFGDRWSLRGQYFDAGRATTAVLEEDIEWEDVVFGQGSSVTTGSHLELTRFFFARDLSNSLQHEFGLGLGLHRLEVGAGILGTIIVNGEPIVDEYKAVSATAPLPNIGAWYAYSPSEKWVFDVRVDWFEASIGEYSGGLLNSAIGANFQFHDHFGIGLKYQSFRLDLDVDKPDWHGNVTLKYEGIYFYLSANWH